MRKILILGFAVVLAVLTLGFSTGSANAYTAPDGHRSYVGEVVTDPTTGVSTTIQTVDMEVHLTDLPTYYHQFDLTFTPAVDGVVTFSGVGKQFDNGGEIISGSVDTTNHTVTWVSQYLHLGDGSIEVGNTWGVTNAPYTVNADGSFDWTGVSDQRQSGYNLTGVLRNVPTAPVAPVAGNHGQCVSGATHAGIKGTKLAAIAKDGTKIGAYGSATCPLVG
jgi:hypothetical protein